ncbi:sigma-70 family RNA polymerase sigma factor [Demequina sp. TTPB684]|uniref:sigma-70 family RNA polymerase sigma factor n=1 Tax=unclassified Demequina TaxID=2620311 RepID=UPI001CF1D09C|nr:MULTISPECIES: sigma-70 family RNA polymerase sigma factor [unclassified Demequina]MCB2411964.1 sigma-70 family RNA polymerase sigma factor [Demequina sp. TTPB684]UPU87904.1 sigma-70 family RNA polymerase sigma factor [Demequina sp. TMPB413]
MNEAMNRSNALVEAHLALVGYNVNEVLARVPSHVSRADLMSAGAMALVRAARSFDDTKGVPFARYASMRIRGALVDELRSMDWVPRGARRRARTAADVSDMLTSRLGRTPTKAEIAHAMGISVEEVHAAHADADTRVLSMDAFDGAVADMVVDSSVGPLDALVNSEQIEYLRAGIECLPEKLAYVVDQLFFHDRPVVELAEEMGLTRSRISQLRTEALALLKDGLKANLDSDAVPTVDPHEGVVERRRKAYYAAIAARTAETRGAAAVAPSVEAASHAWARAAS